MNAQPVDCLICGAPIKKPRRGPIGKTCSPACRTALHRRNHPEVVVLYLGDVLLDTEKAPAPDTRSDRHHDLVGVVIDSILWARGYVAQTRDEQEAVAILRQLGPSLRVLHQHWKTRPARERDVLAMSEKIERVLAEAGQ